MTNEKSQPNLGPGLSGERWEEKFDEAFPLTGKFFSKAKRENIKTFIRTILSRRIKYPEKVLHKHDSIPCYTGAEKEGCVICIKNAAIDEFQRLNGGDDD